MAYCLNAGETVAEGVKRIAREQIDAAIAHVEDGTLDRHKAVHEIRKRCKQLRGLVRLVRGPLEADGSFRRENARFRDAARPLSPVRDAEAILGTFDTLMDRFQRQIDRQAFAPVRDRLCERRQGVAGGDSDLGERLAGFAAAMREAHERVEAWPINGDGYGAIRHGLILTYRLGRQDMRAAFDDPTPELFHDWRKRVKDHHYQMRLLAAVWPPVVLERCKEAKRLGALLGDDHDLAVFRQLLLDQPEAFGDRRDIQALTCLIDRRCAQIQAKARTLGERLYAEKPKSFTSRFRRYWRVWQAEDERGSAVLAEAAAPAPV